VGTRAHAVQVREKVHTGYAKLNIDTELMSMPLRGNTGRNARKGFLFVRI
jgi:hypothetical protein